jgi:hypothetical protein
MPSKGIEIPEGSFGHTVSVVTAPSSKHRVQAAEEISKGMVFFPPSVLE